MGKYEERKICWKIIKDEIVDYDAYEKWDFKKALKQTIIKNKFFGTVKEANELCKAFEQDEYKKLSENKKKQKKIKWFIIWKKIDYRNDRL